MNLKRRDAGKDEFEVDFKSTARKNPETDEEVVAEAKQ